MGDDFVQVGGCAFHLLDQQVSQYRIGRQERVHRPGTKKLFEGVQVRIDAL
ncbi:hypothetical protein D3C86_2265070 [compost metagenome]